MPNERNVTKEIAPENKNRNPRNAPENIIDDETPIRHTSNTCYKRCKGTDNRNKTSKNNRLPSIFVIELVSPAKVLFIEKT